MSGPGRLVVVGTPLGNLGDLSPRATLALQTADLILAEDTRHSRPLLDAAGATAKTLSCHQHNEEERVHVVLERIVAGERVVLISDAGAPAVSDPGGRIVAAIVAAGERVEVVPGPSAPIAALMGAGLDTTRFTFFGFLPRKGRSRQKILESAAQSGHALVIFEAANRVEATLEDLYATCGPRRVVVGRELTKKFETFHRGTLGGSLTPEFVEKGEVVIVVEAGTEEGAATAGPSVEERALQLALDDSISPRDRSKILGAEFHLSRKEAYRRILEAEAATPGSRDADEDLNPKTEGAETEEMRADVSPSVEAIDDSASPNDVVTASQPVRSLKDAKAGILERARVTAAERSAIRDALDDASRALIRATVLAAKGKMPSLETSDDVAQALLELTKAPRRLPAPQEEEELLRALLGATGAAEALDEAIEMMSESVS